MNIINITQNAAAGFAVVFGFCLEFCFNRFFRGYVPVAQRFFPAKTAPSKNPVLLRSEKPMRHRHLTRLFGPNSKQNPSTTHNSQLIVRTLSEKTEYLTKGRACSARPKQNSA